MVPQDHGSGEPMLNGTSRLKSAKQGPETLAEQRLRLVFDESPVGIVFLDLSGNVVDCNRSFVQSLGIERSDVVGKSFTGIVAREDRDDVNGQMSKLVMGTAPAARLDGIRLPGAGGRELSASMVAGRIEEGKEVSGLIVHVLDATEHRNLEIQFAHAQKMQAVGQLAGGIAHDFNNVLTAILGFCDLLFTRHEPGDPSFDDILQIRTNAARASNLVRQLLAFSRKQTLEPEVLDVGETLSDLSTMLGRLLGGNIELRFEHGKNVGLVRVDPGQFDQVIVNLAVNARDAMPSGGTLTIRTSQAVVAEPVHRGSEVMQPGTYVLIEVIDTGVGIPKEILGSIFEPFFSTKEVGEGTGLGLSTVYGIVRQTEGFICVDSAVGEGTVFNVYLPTYRGSAMPRDGAPSSAVSSAEKSARTNTETGSILLVDDEDAVRAFAARALRNKGYFVLEAINGENALDVIAAHDGEIKLIVSDVVMPGMDGHTLVRIVRQQLGEIRAILVSGYAEEAAVNELNNNSDVCFLPKPFTLADLTEKVKEAMNR
jgi:two-component system cell cycle sensor histidine kinase/response regulator CckA